MNKLKKITSIRKKLSANEASIGGWMQIPSSTIAEIIGNSGYDWVAVDMEHGTIDYQQLPDIFRALELGGATPIVRVMEGTPLNCRRALDAGAAGLIVPLIESSDQVKLLLESCKWPPKGNRGVGFSRANLFGERFDSYFEFAQAPLFIPMIESIKGVNALEDILRENCVDGVFIGPYDLTASLGVTGDFNSNVYLRALDTIRECASKYSIPVGMHLIEPSEIELQKLLHIGYRFIAYSLDSVMFRKAVKFPELPR